MRRRAFTEGRVRPLRGGYCAFAWVLGTGGLSGRRYVYGCDQAEVGAAWRQMKHEIAKEEPMDTEVGLDELALSIVCEERVGMHLIGDDRVEAIRRLVAAGLATGEIAGLLLTTPSVISVVRARNHIPHTPNSGLNWVYSYLYGKR